MICAPVLPHLCPAEFVISCDLHCACQELEDTTAASTDTQEEVAVGAQAEVDDSSHDSSPPSLTGGHGVLLLLCRSITSIFDSSHTAVLLLSQAFVFPCRPSVFCRGCFCWNPPTV